MYMPRASDYERTLRDQQLNPQSQDGCVELNDEVRERSDEEGLGEHDHHDDEKHRSHARKKEIVAAIFLQTQTPSGHNSSDSRDQTGLSSRYLLLFFRQVGC